MHIVRKLRLCMVKNMTYMFALSAFLPFFLRSFAKSQFMIYFLLVFKNTYKTLANVEAE